jgi:hypothetical protein
MAQFNDFAGYDEGAAGALVGYVSARAEQVTAYYFGSSSGSKQKTEIIGKAFGWGGRGWRVGKEAESGPLIASLVTAACSHEATSSVLQDGRDRAQRNAGGESRPQHYGRPILEAFQFVKFTSDGTVSRDGGM